MTGNEMDDDEEKVLLLNAKDVNKILQNIPIQKFIENQMETFKTFSSSSSSSNTWQSPARTVMKTENCAFLFMPSTLNEKTTIKCVSVPQKQTSKGLPAIGLLFDESQSGRTKVIINVDQLTAVRTASGCLAASISMQPLKEKGGKIVIFGKGNQAKWHAKLFIEYYKLKKVSFIIRNKDEMKDEEIQNLFSDFKQTLSDDVGDEIQINYIQQGSFEMNKSLEQADFICCCTPSIQPLFDYDQIKLKSNIHFSLIGSYQPHMQEVPSKVIERASKENALTVDSIEACKKEAGDLLKSNTSSESWIEIGNLISSSSSTNHQDLSNHFSLFKSVGFALQDSAIINLISQYAFENKIGTKIDFF